MTTTTMMYLFESDEEFDNSTHQMDILIRKHPEQSAWLLFVKQVMMTSAMDYLFEEQHYHRITIILRHPTSQHILAEFELHAPLEQPLYPTVPPTLRWIGPRYPFSDMLGIEFMDTLLPKKWNLCVDLIDDVIFKIKEYVTPLSMESVECQYSEIEQFIISFIHFTGMYPCKFDSTMPCFGITKIQPKVDHGTGYGSGKVIGTLESYHDYRKQHRALVDQLVTLLKADEHAITVLQTLPIMNYFQSCIGESSLQNIEMDVGLYMNYYYLIDRLHVYDLQPKFKTLWTEWISLKDPSLEVTSSEQEVSMMISHWQTNEVKEAVTTTTVNEYKSRLQDQQYVMVDHFQTHVFMEKHTEQVDARWIRRITREWRDMIRNEMLMLEGIYGSIFIRWSESKNSLMKVMMCPSKGTPYFGGCFVFDIFLPSTYPATNPLVTFLTTGKGTVRFNPNLYNCGKVCLSLLGTWQGERWDPQVSNLVQLLMSILTMIFVEDPYFNEPGYEGTQHTPAGKTASMEYNQRVQRNTILWGVQDMILFPPVEFREVIYTHFRLIWEEMMTEYRTWSCFESLQSVLQEAHTKL